MVCLYIGLIIVISYYFQMFWYCLFIMISRLSYSRYYYDDVYEQPGWFVIWDLAILIFGSFQLWILTRAMVYLHIYIVFFL